MPLCIYLSPGAQQRGSSQPLHSRSYTTARKLEKVNEEVGRKGNKCQSLLLKKKKVVNAHSIAV